MTWVQGSPWCTDKARGMWAWRGFPGGSAVKNPTANAGDSGSIPRSGRSPGEGNGNPLQYSCLGKPDGLQSRGSQRTGLSDTATKWALVLLVESSRCVILFSAYQRKYCLLTGPYKWKTKAGPSESERWTCGFWGWGRGLWAKKSGNFKNIEESREPILS